MLRTESTICGTTTTGTGTLTLAACPAPPGGLDPYAAFQAMGMGTSATIPIPYTIIEFTDATFQTAKTIETGAGGLLVGANIGATTLARTTVITTATSLNATPTHNFNAPTAISIGTAANTLVLIAANAAHTLAMPAPWINSTDNDALSAVMGWGFYFTTTLSLVSGTEYFTPFVMPCPLLVKRMGIRVVNAYTSGTTDLYLRLYALGSNGRPGKLICDYGACVTAGSSLNSANTNIKTGVAANPPFLVPGLYIASALAVVSGTSGGPATLRGTSGPGFSPGVMGISGGLPAVGATATSGNTTAPDSANSTGYSTVTGQSPNLMFFNA